MRERHRRDDRRGRKRPPRRLAVRGRHRRDAVLRRRAALRPGPAASGPSATASSSRRATRRPVLYAALAEAGYFGRDHLATLRKLGSMLQGHPDSRRRRASRSPPARSARGSRSPPASRPGCAAARCREPSHDDRTVFCLMGDGELQEGQVWEAAMFAAHERPRQPRRDRRPQRPADRRRVHRGHVPGRRRRQVPRVRLARHRGRRTRRRGCLRRAGRGEGLHGAARRSSSPTRSRARASRSWRATRAGTARRRQPSRSRSRVGELTPLTEGSAS